MDCSSKTLAAVVAPAILATLAFAPAQGHAQAALSQTSDVNPNGLVRDGDFVRDRNVGVRDRPRPEYNTNGISVGAWQLLPAVAARVGTNDNIYATDQNTRSDTIYRLQPGALLQSQWSNHYVGLFASGNIVEYQDADQESYSEWEIGATGRLDVRRDTAVAAGASYEHLIEPRTSTSSPSTAAEPVRYDEIRANIGAAKNFNRVRVAGRVGIRDLDYEDTRAADGTVIRQRDRSNTEYYGEGRVEYALSPATSLFVGGIVNKRDFRNAPAGFSSRDTNGYEVSVGTNLDVSRLVRGEVMIGYLSQEYDDAAYGDVSGLSLRGSLEYFATPLLTLGISGQRRVEDAAIAGAGGYLSSTVALRADYEFRRNVIVTGDVQYRHDDYSGIDRQDEATTVSLSAIYLLNRAVSLTGLLQRLDQDSSGSVIGPHFDVNRAQVSVVYQF